LNKPNNKRPRGRSSGGSGGGGGGGRRPQHSGNRSFDSNGPEVKVRGTATQICDKYLMLARDASSSGDRVRAESLLQHAEHYFRLINGGDDARSIPNQGGRQSHAPAGVTVSGEMTDEIVAQPQGQGQSSQGQSAPDQSAQGEQSQDQQSQGQRSQGQPRQDRPSRRARADAAAANETPQDAADADQESAEAVVIVETVATDAPENTGDEAEVIVETVAEVSPEDDNADQSSEVA